VVLCLLAAMIAGCSVIGASQITVGTRNESDEPMVVRVLAGLDEASEVYGETFTVGPTAVGDLTLQVPGGDWTVEVNGGRLLSTSDTAGRVGELPVTLVVRADGLVTWEAPSDWVEAGR
jgi:hypothetical protein